MWTNPTINSDSFQKLKRECNFRKLRLWLARDIRDYEKIGANYGVYCKFSDMQIHRAETLQEIADYLKIGGVYD